MSDFWTWGNFVSWQGCIDANRICNLESCPKTMDCCVTNCLGMPTIKGIVLFISVVVIITFLAWVFSNIKLADKTIKEIER